MRFHLIDRVDSIDPFRRVVARKLTSHLEPYWKDEGRGPEMPAALVLEALCQAGTWLVMESTDLGRRAALLSVDDVRFLGPVRPGDVLTLLGTVESIGPETAVLSGHVSVDEREVLTADAIMCALLPVEALEDVGSVRARRDLLFADGTARAA